MSAARDDAVSRSLKDILDYVTNREKTTDALITGVNCVAQTWFELYSKPVMRPSTAEYYARFINMRIIPELGDIKLGKLTARDIQKFYNDLKDHGRVREAQMAKSGWAGRKQTIPCAASPSRRRRLICSSKNTPGTRTTRICSRRQRPAGCTTPTR